MASLVLGVDVGTTAVKAVALDGLGQVAASAGLEHDLLAPHPGWAEGDPARWWDNVVGAVRTVGRAVDLAEVAAVGVSGMVPALLLLDGEGQVLRPAIQQNDARTGAEIRWLGERLDREAFFAATGQPLSQQLVAPRLLWLHRHEPEVHRAIRRVLGSSDWVTGRLTGQWGVEQNWALEAGLWDARHRQWYRPVLRLARIPELWLPPVRAAHEVVGEVTRAAAEETGLRRGTPVVAGSADHVAAALAAGIGPGEVVLKIGGAGDVLYSVDAFAPDPRLYIDYHDVPGRYLLNGCMAASGSLVKWWAEVAARELADREDRYAVLDAEAARVPPGSEGLVVLPYFLGEKTPLFDPEARGVLFGLTLSHGRGHVHRAILEAVACGFRHHVEVLEEAGHAIHNVRIMDRGAGSALWRQIVADTLGRRVEWVPGADLGSASGAALVAGVAVGFWGWERPVPKAGAVVHEPEAAAARRLTDLYGLYRDLYTRLGPAFQAAGASARGRS